MFICTKSLHWSRTTPFALLYDLFGRQRHMAQLFALAASLCALHVCSVVAPQSSNSTIKGKEVVIFFELQMNRKQQGVWDQVFSWWLRTWGSHFLEKESFAFIPLLCPLKGLTYFLWEVILCSSCCHSTFPTCIVGKKTVKVSCSLAKWFSSHKKKLVGKTCVFRVAETWFLPPVTPTKNSVFHHPPEVCKPAPGFLPRKGNLKQLTNSRWWQLKDLLTTAHIFFK